MATVKEFKLKLWAKRWAIEDNPTELLVDSATNAEIRELSEMLMKTVKPDSLVVLHKLDHEKERGSYFKCYGLDPIEFKNYQVTKTKPLVIKGKYKLFLTE